MRSRLRAIVLAVVVVTAMAGVGATGAAGASGESGTATGASTTDGTTIASSFDGTVESGHFEVGSGEQNDQDHFEFTECPDGEGEECIEISGDVDEDGSFHASDVHFPPITVEDTSAGDIDVYITAPNGLQGQIQENGEMTLGGELYVDLRELSEGCGIDVTLDATTGDSGDLSGSAIDVSEDGETGTATLVDNEFSVPEAQGCGMLNGAVNDELDLPSPSGENEMVMNTHFEFGYEDAAPQTGTVQGTVTNANGDPVVGATVTLDGQEVATDDTGSFQGEATDGEHDLTVSAAGYNDTQTTVDVTPGESTSADVALEPDGETDYRVAGTPLEGESGDTVTTDVVVEPVSGDAGEVDELETIFEYDRDALSFEDASAGDWDSVEVQHDDGTITASADETGLLGDGIEAPFTAFTAEFELVGEPGTETTSGFDAENSAFSGDHGGLFGIGEPGVAYDDVTVSVGAAEEPDDGGDAPDDGSDAPDDGDAGAPDDGDDGSDEDDGGVGTPDDGDAPNETAPDDGEFDPDAWADWLEAQSDALEAEYYEKVPGEINAQSQERINTDIVEPVSSPEEMRTEADKIEEDLGDVHDDADQAYGALRDAADFIEEFRPMFSEAAESLRNADDPEAEAERINEEVIDYVNADVEESNERLENVEPIGTVDHIDTEGGGPDSTESGADGDGGDDGGDSDEESTTTLGSSLASIGAGVALISTLAGVVISLWSTLGTGMLTRKP